MSPDTAWCRCADAAADRRPASGKCRAHRGDRGSRRQRPAPLGSRATLCTGQTGKRPNDYRSWNTVTHSRIKADHYLQRYEHRMNRPTFRHVSDQGASPVSTVGSPGNGIKDIVVAIAPIAQECRQHRAIGVLGSCGRMIPLFVEPKVVSRAGTYIVKRVLTGMPHNPRASGVQACACD